MGRNSGANSILIRDYSGFEYEKHDVPSISLDSEFSRTPSVALWIDVEGASKQVILGGKQTLSNAAVVKIEVEDYERWQGQWTADAIIETLFDLDLVPVARDFEYKGQYNIIFISKLFLSNQEIRRNIEYYYSVLSKKNSGF